MDDLNEKYKKEYFADTAFYIADRKDTNELDDILNGINQICFSAICNNWDSETKVNKLFGFLKEQNIKIKIPCLLAYTKDIYKDSNKLKSKLEKEIQQIIKSVDTQFFNIELGFEWEVIFWIFPVKDIDYIRKELVKLKKEAK